MELIRINGVGLEVQTLHNPHATPGLAPLVFLHEGLGSIALWHARQGFWPEQLCAATGRHGMVYSRRGYGHSDTIPDVRGSGRLQADYMAHEAWTVLPALLQQLGIHQPVLVGHSDGGTIALLHAARHSLSACVVMAPHVMVEAQSIQAIAAAREAFEQGELRQRLQRFHADVDCAFWQWNDVWLSEAFRNMDIRALCRQIQAPVLAIQGDQDPYGSMAQIDDIQPQHGRISRLALTGCGHSPHREQPESCTQAIAAFLAPQP